MNKIKNVLRFEQLKVGDPVYVSFISSDVFETWKKSIKKWNIDKYLSRPSIALQNEDGVGVQNELYSVTPFESTEVLDEDGMCINGKRETTYFIIATSKKELDQKCEEKLIELRNEAMAISENYKNILNKEFGVLQL